MADVIEELAKDGHLNSRQAEAAVRLLAALRAHHGRSDGLVMAMRDKVDVSRRPALRPPGGGAGMGPAESMLKRLRQHERQLLAFLVQHRELPRGSLADFGRQHSGYKTSKTQRAYVTGRVAAFLESLAEELV